MSDEPCRICGRTPTERHHMISGTANRRLAEEDGLVVSLCHEHHVGLWGVHRNNIYWKRKLQMEAQERYEEKHTRDEFRRRYGKSWL